MHPFVSRVACAATLLFTAVLAQAGVISLTPTSTSVNVGDVFAIDIMASDLNPGGYELTVGFSPALVSLPDPFNPVEFFEFLGGPGGSIQGPNSGLDFVEADETSFLTDPADLIALQGTVPGNLFRLARIQFRAEQQGTADFSFLFDYLTNLDGSSRITADLVGTRVQIGEPTSAVPEPGTVMLAAAGLGAIVVLRRRSA